jgi:hypothetical protein
MSLHRHALAVVFAAALVPAGNASSEPATQPAASAPALPVDGIATPPADAYRFERSAPALTGQQASFSMAAAVRPGVAPGTTAWLARNSSEPLASSYAAPQAMRKESGISYSSDGRMYAYVAEPERPADALPPHDRGSNCCAGTDGAVPPAHYARAVEPPGVTSLLGQLKRKGLKLALDDGWKLSAGARSREYADSTLNTRVGHVTLQRWWGDWTTAYSMQFEKRGGWNLAPSQALQLGYAFSPRSTLGIAYTTGQELAFFGNQGVMKTEVHSLALQGEHAVDKTWSLRFDAGYYNHGDLPAYRTVRIAFRWNL